ncbi:MAG: hypothetical protein ACRBC3_12115 [Burkholderiaceae bacterium]
MSLRFIRTAALAALLSPLTMMNALAHAGHDHKTTSTTITEHHQPTCHRGHQHAEHRPDAGDRVADCPPRQDGHDKT